MREPDTDDLLAAAAFCREQFQAAQERDWSVRAGELEWDCRRTLTHMADALAMYSRHLATRAPARLPNARHDVADLSIADLLILVPAVAHVLAEVAKSAPPSTRAFHPAGMADVSGFMAMGCTELLVHGYDIARGLDHPYRPEPALCARVVARLFPWAPTEGDGWENLLWASGRVDLPQRPRLDADWYWQCAPLSEWDGTIKRRSAPPAWR